MESYELKYSLNEKKVRTATNKDGIFPLVTNTELAPTEILKTYKNQSFLEKRFNCLKSVSEVAPVFLEKRSRIEAMLFLYTIALMLIALIERKIHRSMKEQNIEKLPILPQKMKTVKPTWSNIKLCFNSVIMISLSSNLSVEQTENQQIVKGLGNEQKRVLKSNRSTYLFPIDNYREMSP